MTTASKWMLVLLLLGGCGDNRSVVQRQNQPRKIPVVVSAHKLPEFLSSSEIVAALDPDEVGAKTYLLTIRWSVTSGSGVYPKAWSLLWTKNNQMEKRNELILQNPTLENGKAFYGPITRELEPGVHHHFDLVIVTYPKKDDPQRDKKCPRWLPACSVVQSLEVDLRGLE